MVISMKKGTFSCCLKDSEISFVKRKKKDSEISVQEARHWTFRTNQHVLAKGQRRNMFQSLLDREPKCMSIWIEGSGIWVYDNGEVDDVLLLLWTCSSKILLLPHSEMNLKSGSWNCWWELLTQMTKRPKVLKENVEASWSGPAQLEAWWGWILILHYSAQSQC